MKPADRVELNKRYIGFVFQQYHLLDSLTVYENHIPLSYRNIKRSERSRLSGTRSTGSRSSERKPTPTSFRRTTATVAVARAVLPISTDPGG
jgi:ABC-type lipoprotein export system ATPase subunit